MDRMDRTQPLAGLHRGVMSTSELRDNTQIGNKEISTWYMQIQSCHRYLSDHNVAHHCLPLHPSPHSDTCLVCIHMAIHDSPSPTSFPLLTSTFSSSVGSFSLAIMLARFHIAACGAA